MQAAIGKVPAGAWQPAYDGNGQARDGAWVADITGLLELSSWPAGMRVIVRKERPHPGAQLRFTDLDGHRFTAFATDAKRGQLADLELRHRRRARCEDCIRCAKDTGLRNLPSRASPRTSSGARSSPSPASCWPGPSCSPSRELPAAGNRNGSACACSASPGASPAAAAACACGSRNDGPGPGSSPPPSPACRPSHPADQQQPPLRPRKDNTKARGTPPTRRDSRAPSRARQPEINPSRTPQASRSRARKIEVSCATCATNVTHTYSDGYRTCGDLRSLICLTTEAPLRRAKARCGELNGCKAAKRR